MKTWVKLKTKINHDPEIGTLSWAHRGIWSALLALAGEIDDRDGDDRETGRLDTPENTAWRIRCDWAEFQAALAEFTNRDGWMDDRDGILYITKYRKAQERPPSASHKAVAARVQRSRARKAQASNDGVTTLPEAVTPPESESDTEKSNAADAAGTAVPNGDPTTFDGWIDLLQADKANRTAILLRMHNRLYPDRDEPEFGYVGAVAKRIGARRLAELLWQQSTRPPVDDVLAYCVKVAKNGGKQGARASPEPGTRDYIGGKYGHRVKH